MLTVSSKLNAYHFLGFDKTQAYIIWRTNKIAITPSMAVTTISVLPNLVQVKHLAPSFAFESSGSPTV
jgi:hypothetical protein